jgi:hypothetical protein
MKQEDIIRMAREAGMAGFDGTVHVMFQLEAFATLVEEAATEAANARATSSWTLMCEKMVAFEREAILELVDSYAKNNTDLADAIRARGQA